MLANKLKGAGGLVGGAEFDPSALFVNGEDGFWYDPSDLTTMWTDTAGTVQATVGDKVARIDDKSGNGLHATQSSFNYRPYLRQSGSLYYLEYGETKDESLNTATANSGFTGIGTTVGVSMQTRDDFREGLVTFANALSGGFDLYYDGFDQNYSFSVVQENNTFFVNAPFESVPNTRVITGELDLTIPEASISSDGVIQNTGTPVETSMFNRSDIYRIGWSLSGYIYQVVFLGRSYTAEEKTAVEQYVAAKTGVTL